MGDRWNAARMLELGRKHAALEAARNLEELMATLVENPVYEFYPLGLRMEGGIPVRENLLASLGATGFQPAGAL